MNSTTISTFRGTLTLLFCTSICFGKQIPDSSVIPSEQVAASWDMQRVSPSNSLRGKFPIHSKRAYDYIRLIRQTRDEFPERKALIKSFFDDPSMIHQIGELIDFLAYSHILLLESNPDIAQSAHYKKFGITPQIGNQARSRAYADAQEIEQVFSLHACTTLGLLCRILDRTRDERALPLLGRMYFFYGPFYMMGNDSWYSEPGWIAHDSFRNLLYWVRRDLWEQMPKVKATMDSDVFLDSVRVWILDRKQLLLPSGVPQVANVQEIPFRQFLEKIETPITAPTSEPANTTEPAKTPKSKSHTLIFAILGGSLLIITVIWKTRRKWGQKRFIM